MLSAWPSQTSLTGLDVSTPSLGSQRVQPETDMRAQKASKTFTELFYNGALGSQSSPPVSKVFGFHLNFSLRAKPARQHRCQRCSLRPKLKPQHAKIIKGTSFFKMSGFFF